MKAFIEPPISGRVRDGETVHHRSIGELRLVPLPDGASPDRDVLASCANKLVDEAGNRIAPEILSGFDLESALRQAARSAFSVARD